MTGWLLGWVIISNECALIVSALYFFLHINFTEIIFTEIDVKICHEKPHKISQMVLSL